MNHDSIKLTVYSGERARIDGVFLADALLDLWEHHRLRTSVLLRGNEGFGLRHHLRTDRLLSLSEDLPVVAAAVDTSDRIEAVLPEVERLAASGGLITLERAWMPGGAVEAGALPGGRHEAVKLTLYIGRLARAADRPAYRAVVDVMRSRGLDGATVLLGVDGTALGERRRARFVGMNADVPLMVVGVGGREGVAEAIREITELVEQPLMTVERVRICKRDGELLATPEDLAGREGGDPDLRHQLTVFAGEQAEHDGRPLHRELVRRLRAGRAAGATTLRGIWGYDGDDAPHGDTLWSLRRRVPMLTVAVESPERIANALAIVDAVTDQQGLVISEIVPAHRATAKGVHAGRLKLD